MAFDRLARNHHFEAAKMTRVNAKMLIDTGEGKK